MPKKFQGENSKAVAARERKEAQKTEKEQKLKKMIEDAEWQDDDDKLKKKQQKKEEQEKKRLEQLQKKAEAKALLEKELETINKAPKAAKAPPPPKVTRAQISQMKEKTVKAEPEKPVPARVVVEEPPLEENLNRIQLDGEVAQSVDEALAILGDKADVDRHPEKRQKAAYTAFEELNLPRLKAENPSLRLSQLKQMLRKEWLKSPQNPLNQNQ
ncbi:hypothetical protein O0L34_g14819 [Tuta absoluta]|nr:hypothetical protein O0L34_g14819 [Tuta absoluta]